MLKMAKFRFPENTPTTKEGFRYRAIFQELFPQVRAVRRVDLCATVDAGRDAHPVSSLPLPQPQSAGGGSDGAWRKVHRVLDRARAQVEQGCVGRRPPVRGRPWPAATRSSRMPPWFLSVDFEDRADCSGRAVHGVHSDAYAQRWRTEDRSDDSGAGPDAKKAKAV